MKFLTLFLTISFGVAVIAPMADARGDRARSAAASRGGGSGQARAAAAQRGGGGGGSADRARAAAAQRGGGSSSNANRARAAAAQRSPMTNSRIERPKPNLQGRTVTRPQNPPARPAARPATRPVERPSVQRPTTLPQGRPANLPERRPDALPGNRLPEGRPTTLPDRRPDLQPGNRLPGALPPGMNRPGGDRPNISRPDGRPSLERPGVNRPSTLPGMVTYPNRPGNNRPSLPGLGGNDRPNLGGNVRDRINIGDRNNVNIGNINVGGRNVGLNRPNNLPAGRRNWDNNKWGGNRSAWGNRVNIGNSININNNFYRNNNFAFRPTFWGAHPWWGAGNSFHWHHGHWNFGWNSSFYRRSWWHTDSSFASGFMWGISVWSLGNLIYDMGYQTYRNPYPAPVVQNTFITYQQPISVAAAANPPGDDKIAEIAEEKSSEALERSRAAFKEGDYLAAFKAVDEALAHTPGDVTLHEYRALILFALGRYTDAAGVLNPVLASGPGWSWDTMIGFYNGSEPYNEQLRKLESYVKSSPEKADGRFLLGYHYMVCGFMEKAYQEFAKASELQPADTISRQLRDLTKSSIPDNGESEVEREPQPEPVSMDKLIGTWISDRGDDGKVTFTMTAEGDYTWNFMNNGKSTELKGTFGLNEMGLLILSSDDTQMVSSVELKESSKLQFTLIGAPEGDPGLLFARN